ncbi:carboxypeptidase regulatory-like domain-containing protein [Archangium lipolyticum]|uniref:carboxypeptidase regulatory-like domain-containing protein n=1 Tax=Archangium lipolyticum TaxID=2970465 RepID=UPI00214A3024|nr:carboxypeptidase regulatory-like domain-containing protein [Archangium lipolyticum]
MKPQSAVPLYRMALVALVLLCLPGSAWAQVALSGQVKFADGSVLSGATVSASPTSGGSSLYATSDASGLYVLNLIPGTYNISVQFTSPGFYGSQRVVQSHTVGSSATLNLTLSDILLTGRVLNASGQPVAGVQLSGYGYSMEGSNYLSPTSGSDGRFTVRMIPGTYSSMQLTPPTGSPYAITSLPNETFSVSTSKDFVLTNAVILSGQVKFADGSGVSGATVSASSTSGGPSLYATSDALGAYSLNVAPGTYNISVQFTSPGFYGSQRVVQSHTVSNSTTLNLTLSDILLNGRVLDASGQPVAGVQLSGYGYSMEGSNYLSPTSGSDGRFTVRMLPGTYSSMQLTPPASSPYAITSLPNETFSVSTSKDFVLTNAFKLSGQVKFADGSGVSGATVSANPTSGSSSQYTTSDASGLYSLNLSPGTYNISVQFNSPGFYGSQRVVQSYTFSASTTLNLTLSDILLNGRVLNTSGQPVAGAQLSGYGYSMEGSNYLSPTSGSDGRFTVRMLPGTYSSMQLNPASGSGYLQTPLPNETFSTSGSSEYVIADLDECGYNNGGCSENAICTNIPGSRTCACKPGYSGDGFTCAAAPARVILNEILANEPGSTTSGEFVEVVNVGGTSIDIGGWTLSDATAVRHTFAAGTVLAPGKALVVFGGASGIPVGLSNAVGASTGTLNLANTTDTVTLKNTANASIDSYTYSSSLASADGVSMNRSPDATVGAGFVLHNTLSSLTASAGKRSNGTAF